jgi:alpha-mannosidase II
MISVELNKQQRALFSRRTGFLQKIILNSDTATAAQDQSSSLKTKLKLIKYGVTNAREKSGAYLFLPDGPAVDVDSSLFQWIRVEHVDTEAAVRLRTRVCTNMTIVLHCVEFYPTLDKRRNVKYPLINVWNVVDLRQSHNYELAMHLETSIQNKVSWNFILGIYG